MPDLSVPCARAPTRDQGCKMSQEIVTATRESDCTVRPLIMIVQISQNVSPRPSPQDQGPEGNHSITLAVTAQVHHVEQGWFMFPSLHTVQTRKHAWPNPENHSRCQRSLGMFWGLLKKPSRHIPSLTQTWDVQAFDARQTRGLAHASMTAWLSVSTPTM